MITFKTFLMERANYPLYHGTDFGSLEKIINSNTLKTGFQSKEHWPAKNGQIVSFSRNYNFSKRWADMGRVGVVIQFNRAKLAHNYKIKPFNFFPDKARAQAAGFEFENQFEEAIDRDITHVMKYVDAIYISPTYASIAQKSDIWDEIEEYVVFGEPKRK